MSVARPLRRPMETIQAGRLELLAVPRHGEPSEPRHTAATSTITVDYRSEYRDAVRLTDFPDAQQGLVELTRRRSFARQVPPERAISTIHKAKGLECENALVLPCDKRFPINAHAEKTSIKLLRFLNREYPQDRHHLGELHRRFPRLEARRTGRHVCRLRVAGSTATRSPHGSSPVSGGAPVHHVASNLSRQVRAVTPRRPPAPPARSRNDAH